jgi:DNA primase
MQQAFDREGIESFKRELSITAVADRLGLCPVHGKIRCLHPMRHSHGDRTPSVSLSESKGLFRCWVCADVRGDVIELVSQVNNLSFRDALGWLKDMFPHAVLQASISNPSTTTAPKNPAPNRPIEKRVEPLLIPEPELPIVVPSAREEHWREKTILGFLKMLAPLEHPDSHGRFEARDYLVRRKIFLKTWNAMRLRWVDDYGRVNDALRRDFDGDLLREVGITNEHGNLRFYKHKLIIPYLDDKNRPLHFQARATEQDTTPKELSLRGHIPCPYNVKMLDQRSGLVYLCEGPIDTLTLIDRGIPAVGVPGVSHLKAEWIPLFQNKSVIVCFDNDEAGRTASAKVVDAFMSQGIDAKPLTILPDGTDINDWFTQNK